MFVQADFVDRDGPEWDLPEYGGVRSETEALVVHVGESGVLIVAELGVFQQLHVLRAANDLVAPNK